MQVPPEEAGDSISTENNEREDPDLNRTFAVRRKAAKRSIPWDLVGGELDLISQRQESEDIRATKKPRLEEPFFASTDEASTKLSSHDTAVSLPTADSDYADADPEKGSRTTGYWTPEEDAKLNSAITNTCKKKKGKKYRTDWVTISLLVSGRTRTQCHNRWHQVLDPRIDRANERPGTWTKDEDIKLTDAVQTHGGKNWASIAALVPGRTKV
jgi:hypothetical protein